MLVDIDDELLAAIAEFRNREVAAQVDTVDIARIFQLAVDYRNAAISDAPRPGDVFQDYACQRWPVIARIFRRATDTRKAAG